MERSFMALGCMYICAMWAVESVDCGGHREHTIIVARSSVGPVTGGPPPSSYNTRTAIRTVAPQLEPL
eukprot:5865862-Prymnesium_polylepis.1